MTHIEIPSELPNILRNFTLSVLRTRPRDIIDHAVEYFTQLQRQQKQHSNAENHSASLVSSSSISSSSQPTQQQQTLNDNVLLSGP